MDAPKARKVPYQHEIHGDVRPDEYYWMRNKSNPDVIDYLEAENRYYEEIMKPLAPLTEKLLDEMIGRIPAAEEKVPVQFGSYYYYTRMAKDLQYPIYARKSARNRDQLGTADEEVILDLNQMATDGEYLSVTVQRISPDHTRLAYLENRDGTDRYTAYIKDLQTGDLLEDRIADVFIHDSLEWDATGNYLFYTTVDDTQRPYQLWRHQVGQSTSDKLLYEEKDTTFTLSVSKSRSGKYLFLHCENKETTEVQYLAADDPLSELHLFDARRRGIQYQLEHWREDFLILTNEGAENFRILHCPVTDTSTSAQKDLFPYDENRYLQTVFPFQDAIVLSGRENGLTELWVFQDGSLTKLPWNESLYTVSIADNFSYETPEVLLQYESLLTPKTTYALDLKTHELKSLQVTAVPGSISP